MSSCVTGAPAAVWVSTGMAADVSSGLIPTQVYEKRSSNPTFGTVTSIWRDVQSPSWSVGKPSPWSCGTDHVMIRAEPSESGPDVK